MKNPKTYNLLSVLKKHSDGMSMAQKQIFASELALAAKLIRRQIRLEKISCRASLNSAELRYCELEAIDPNDYRKAKYGE